MYNNLKKTCKIELQFPKKLKNNLLKLQKII